MSPLQVASYGVVDRASCDYSVRGSAAGPQTSLSVPVWLVYDLARPNTPLHRRALGCRRKWTWHATNAVRTCPKPAAWSGEGGYQEWIDRLPVLATTFQPNSPTASSGAWEVWRVRFSCHRWADLGFNALLHTTQVRETNTTTDAIACALSECVVWDSGDTMRCCTIRSIAACASDSCARWHHIGDGGCDGDSVACPCNETHVKGQSQDLRELIYRVKRRLWSPWVDRAGLRWRSWNCLPSELSPKWHRASWQNSLTYTNSWYRQQYPCIQSVCTPSWLKDRIPDSRLLQGLDVLVSLLAAAARRLLLDSDRHAVLWLELTIQINTWLTLQFQLSSCFYRCQWLLKQT